MMIVHFPFGQTIIPISNDWKKIINETFHIPEFLIDSIVEKDEELFVQMSALECPITMELFHEPIITKYGHTYEQSALFQHLNNYNQDPLTRKPLYVSDCQPNKGMKTLIDSLKNNINQNEIKCNIRPSNYVHNIFCPILQPQVFYLYDHRDEYQRNEENIIKRLIIHPKNTIRHLIHELRRQLNLSFKHFNISPMITLDHFDIEINEIFQKNEIHVYDSFAPNYLLSDLIQHDGSFMNNEIHLMFFTGLMPYSSNIFILSDEQNVDIPYTLHWNNEKQMATLKTDLDISHGCLVCVRNIKLFKTKFIRIPNYINDKIITMPCHEQLKWQKLVDEHDRILNPKNIFNEK